RVKESLVGVLEGARGRAKVGRTALALDLGVALEELRGAPEAVERALEIEHPSGRPRIVNAWRVARETGAPRVGGGVHRRGAPGAGRAARHVEGHPPR